MHADGSGGLGRRLPVALAVAFAVLAVIVEVAGDMPGDDWILERLYDVFGTDLDDAMVAVGAVTNTVPIAAAWLVVVVTLFVTDRRPDAMLFFVTVSVAMAGNRLLKEIVARPRPDLRPSPEATSTFAFPSGHAANTLALAGAAYLIAPNATWRRRVLVVGSLAVVLVGFSRVAISVHYPSDILASWLWVGAWLTFLWRRQRLSASD